MIRNILVVLLTLYSFEGYCQTKFPRCNQFEDSTSTVFIDRNGIWQIGQPSKNVFNSSFQGSSSIVTDLDSNYRNNDTSSFYVYFVGIPQYLGLFLPLEFDFYHRFKTDSPNDFGTIHMSFDGGEKWYDVLSTKYNSHRWDGYFLNEHYFLSTNDTIKDSIIIQGNSNGWVHSIISKEIEQLIHSTVQSTGKYVDSIIIRFSFISDSIGTDEGWQIDSLCLAVAYLGVEDLQPQKFKIFPNPNTGTFSIEKEDNNQCEMFIRNMWGDILHKQLITSQTTQVELNLQSGIYLVTIVQDKYIANQKIIIE